MLLGTLVFAPIFIHRGSMQVNPDSDLAIEVNIIESSKMINSSRVVMKFQSSLSLQKETTITLPAPIPIQTGFGYKIRSNLLGSIDGHYYECKFLMAEVNIENDLIIKFSGDRVNHDNQYINLITGFNKLPGND